MLQIFENVVRPKRGFNGLDAQHWSCNVFSGDIVYHNFQQGYPRVFSTLRDFGVYLDSERMDPEGDVSVNSLYSGDAKGIINDALFQILQPEGRSAKKEARKIVSMGAEKRLRNMVLDDPSILGNTIPVQFALDDDIDSFCADLSIATRLRQIGGSVIT